MESLKLVALDADDLAVMSAHLQDAVVRVGDLAYLPDQKRFAFLARRFDWCSPSGDDRRALTGLHFERVLRVRTRHIDRGKADEPLNLLAITFEETDPPSGTATLHFSGGSVVQLDLECMEASLSDLGPVWSAGGGRPGHDAERA